MPARTEVVMGTIVTIQVVRDGAVGDAACEAGAAMDRAFGWFHEIERRCTRFDPASELMQLTAHAGVPVAASEILFEAMKFALMVAEESGGAFDPTVGHRMESRGFNRDYRTGKTVRSRFAPDGSDGSDGSAADGVTWRDVHLDCDRKEITLLRPLTLDLGAVAKGLAVDMAARELVSFHDFAIDAGGDLYLGGLNPNGEEWSVGIRHPRRDGELIESLSVSDQAVCTSGDYERRVATGRAHDPGQHHILDPRSGQSPRGAASATVIAPGAMLADALATAAFVLGPEGGIALLDRMGVDGLIFTSDLKRYETRGLRRAA
jgi:thiamine biosynthesis lipoprotein